MREICFFVIYGLLVVLKNSFARVSLYLCFAALSEITATLVKLRLFFLLPVLFPHHSSFPPPPENNKKLTCGGLKLSKIRDNLLSTAASCEGFSQMVLSLALTTIDPAIVRSAWPGKTSLRWFPKYRAVPKSFVPIYRDFSLRRGCTRLDHWFQSGHLLICRRLFVVGVDDHGQRF